MNMYYICTSLDHLKGWGSGPLRSKGTRILNGITFVIVK